MYRTKLFWHHNKSRCVSVMILLFILYVTVIPIFGITQSNLQNQSTIENTYDDSSEEISEVNLTEAVPFISIVSYEMTTDVPLEEPIPYEETEEYQIKLQRLQDIENERIEKEEREKENQKSRDNLKFDYTLTPNSRMSKDHIDYIIKDTGLKNLGQSFYNIQDTVNPLFAIAVSLQEAGYNTDSYKAINHNNIFGIMTGQTSFPSKEYCIEERFATFIKSGYIDQGLLTVRDAQPKYCPSPTDWASNVESIMKSLYNKALEF